MANVKKRAAQSAALLAILYGARRYYRNWGATKAECRMPLPGDHLVADPAVQTTEAAYIDAQISAVWHWLSQMGQEPGGFDGTEFSERQQLVVGDLVRLAPKGWMGLPEGVTLSVAEVVPEKYVVLDATRPDQRWNAMWSFHLQPHWEDRVRLLTRARIALRHPGEVFLLELVRPVIALGARGWLLGVKHRVERSVMSNPAPSQPIV